MPLDLFGILFWLIPVVVVGAFLLTVGRFLLRAVLGAAGRSLVHSAALHANEAAVPGERLDLRLSLTPRRTLEPSAVEWDLVGEEVAIRRSTTDTTHTHEFERVRAAGRPQGQWRADVPLDLSGSVVVPRAAPPSFTTSNHAIRWSAVARVRVPGHPDLVITKPVTVTTRDSGEARDGRTRQVLEQGPLHGEIDLDLPSDGGVPVAHIRDRLTCTARVWALADVEGRGVSLRLVRLLHGSGTPEEAVREETILHEGDFLVGNTLSAEVEWALPDTAELTFAGRHVKCDWFLDVKVDRPMWTDLHLRFPITVVGA